MKKKTSKNKAFTIVELLAVIVVLAVVLAIAVPRIMKSVEESNKASFKLTGENLMKEAMNQHIQEGMLGEKEYTIENKRFVGNSLKVTGNLPNNGFIFINDKSKVAFALSNDKYCLKKNIYFDDIEITNDIIDCELDTAIPSRCFQVFDISDTETEITGYLIDCPRDVVIPSILNGKTVTSIGEYAFGSHSTTGWYKEEPGKVAYNGSVNSNLDIEGKVAATYNPYEPDFFPINSVVFPDTIVTIKTGAFNGNLIESVIIPNSVVTIGESAFEGNRMTYVSIPNSVTSLGSRAFLGNNLRTYDIGTGLTWIPNYVFAFNPIEIIKIPDNITEVDYEAFYAISSVEELIVGTGLDSLNFISHSMKYSFKKVIINTEHVPSGTGARAETVILGDNVKSIGDDYNSSGTTVFGTDVKKVTFGNSLETINVWAFWRCNIEEVILPNSLTFIGDYAFNGNKLTSVNLPNRLVTIGKYAFTSNLLTSITIPNSVTTIRDGAFSSNRFTSVTVPGNNVTMGKGVFQGNQITNITFSPNRTTIPDSTFYGNSLTSIIIPEGITTIGVSAFFENQLVSVVLPSTLNSLGHITFSSNQITSVTIPANVGMYYTTSISENFYTAYVSTYGKQAGTYTAPSQEGVWTKQP